MPKDTVFTKAFDKAHQSINRSFEMARDRTGGVPIGHHIIDPRTAAKDSAFDINSIWNPVGQTGASTSMTSDYIKPKEFDYKNHPLPKNPGKQSPKVAAAGKVVDPTGIETAQAADSVTVDVPGGNGFDSAILEGG